MALTMEFGFLRNAERKLLSISFLPNEGTLDGNRYDLLASEAQLASFVAIATGDIPSREWFRLGRAVTPTAGSAVQAPTDYPVACSPQAWSATALLAMLQACLGLSFEPDHGVVRFTRPILPECLNEVKLLNLEVGGARISVCLRRVHNEVAMNVISRTGDVKAVLVS